MVTMCNIKLIFVHLSYFVIYITYTSNITRVILFVILGINNWS